LIATMTRTAGLMLMRGSTLLLKFGLSFYLARYLDLQALGLYGLLVGATLLVPTALRAGLTSTLTRTLQDASPANMVSGILHYLAWTAGGYLLLAAALASAHGLHALPALPFPLWLAVAAILAEHLVADVSMLFTNMGRNPTANALGLVQTSAWVLPFVVVSYLVPGCRSIEALLWFWVMGSVLALLIFSQPLWHWPWRHSAGLQRPWFRSSLAASRYLYLSDLTGTAAQFADRYLIAWMIDLEHAGVYTLFFQLANAVYTLVSSGIVNQHRPVVLAAFSRGDGPPATTALRHMQKQALGGVLLVSVATGGIFQWLAPLLQRPLVLEYLPLLWLVLAGMAVKTWCLTEFMALFARQMDRLLLALNLLVLLLAVAGGWAVIPRWGIYGVPLAAGFAYAVALLWMTLSQRPQVQALTP
jgi:O-antigen/teichoic acid export membrane protein